MTNIIFTNRYFFPDESATSQILSDLAFYLAEAGYSVTVVTSRLSYGGVGGPHPRRDKIRGVNIVRIRTSNFGRGNILGRYLDYLSFYISAFFAYFRHVKKGDVLVAKTDPPLLGVVGAVVCLFKSATLANWLQDVYPEIAEEMDVPLINGPVAGILRGVRNWALRRADVNIVIGERMKALLGTLNIPDKKITIINNWCDDDAIKPRSRLNNDIRDSWGFKPEQFVIGYSGNLGLAHDLDTIIQAAIALKNHPNIVFLFVGGGKLHSSLKSTIISRKLTNIILKPYQPREQLGLSLSASDIHWLSLKPALEGKIFPSKFYGILAAGRPVLFVGDTQGEVAQLLSKHSCGFGFSIGDDEALALKIVELANAPAKRDDLGKNARRLLNSNYTKKKSFSRWETLLERYEHS